MTTGKIGVHEFITMDGVIGDPSWLFDYSLDPKTGEAIGAIMGSSKAMLLGRRTYQEFAPSWSGRTADEDPRAPFMNEAPKYVVSASAGRRLEQHDYPRPLPCEHASDAGSAGGAGHAMCRDLGVGDARPFVTENGAA